MRWLALAFVLGCSHPQPAVHGARETVLIHADLYTMDPDHPHATAVAWANGVFTAIGGDELADRPNARVIDLHGHSVTPGLIDAHCHLYELGTDLEAVSVRDAHQASEAATKIAAGQAHDGWILAQGWDQNRWWGPHEFPTKEMLDKLVPDVPVLAERVDGHASWVNSKALELAHVTSATVDPPGGKIVRDTRGEPTGVLIDNAQALVVKVLPAATPATRALRIQAAAKLAIAKGITGIHEMGIADETAAVYRGLAERGELPLRVYAFLRGDPDHGDELATRHPQRGMGRFTMRGVKFFADGALGSRGARLTAPYSDDPANQGLWVTPPDQLARAVKAAATGGWDIAVHAIGDAGVHAVLVAFDGAAPGVNLRVEHTQVIAPADVDLMVKVHAIASMQPTHATSDMPWAEARLGKDRILGAYAWRTILDHHIPLIGGSDFPVEDVGPLLGIYAAVTRQDAAGNPAGGWYPAQRMTLDEAIAAFTRDAAKAEHVTDRGVVKVGNRADLTVYGDKLAPDRSLLTMSIAMTVVDGDVVYEQGAR
jgi:predicted amidohydrolase YtcJ